MIEEPRVRLDEYLAHRREREQQILKLVKKGPAKISDIVTTLYGDGDLPPQLVEAAGWQVHAHLVKLKAEGKVAAVRQSAWKVA